MAAIYQWVPSGSQLFTTPPYPIEDIDSFDFTVSFVAGYDVGVNNETWYHSTALGNGTLLLVYLASDINPETWYHSADIGNGTLLQVYLSSDINPETWYHSADIGNGTLILGVVRHTEQPPEYLDFTDVEWLGGTST
jgi:hypothetical protein